MQPCAVTFLDTPHHKGIVKATIVKHKVNKCAYIELPLKMKQIKAFMCHMA